MFESITRKGGKFLLTLNIVMRPIAQKYREGKMQSTLERELKVSEIAKGEAFAASVFRSQSVRAVRF